MGRRWTARSIPLTDTTGVWDEELPDTFDCDGEEVVAVRGLGLAGDGAWLQPVLVKVGALRGYSGPRLLCCCPVA